MALIRTLTAAAAVAVLTLTSGATFAASFPDFTVDPDRNPGTNNSFVADKIVGGYVEVITFGVSTFSYALRWSAGQFFNNDGTNALSGNTTGLGNTYGLYALVTGSGTFNTSGVVTTFNTNPGGTVEFFYDLFSAGETSFTNFGGAITNQATLFARTNAGADVALLETGAAISGSGTLDPTLSTCGGNGPINCGSFGQTSAIQLNAAGNTFFTQPFPFYNAVFNAGQLNNFSPTSTQVINGSMDLVFNRVPEPTSLALVGLALAGLGFSLRRKS